MLHMVYFLVSKLPEASCSSKQFRLTSSQTILSSNQIARTCPSLTSLVLASSPGQHLNVSMLSFNVDASRSLGRLRDVMTGNVVEMTSSQRRAQLLTSAGSEVEVRLTDWSDVDAVNFLLRVEGKQNKIIFPLTTDGISLSFVQ